MNGPHKLGALLTAAIVLATTSMALGDPEPAPSFAHLADPSVLTTHSGISLALPADYYLMDHPTFTKYDTADVTLKKAQDRNTDLQAQNDSLRASVSGWRPGWYTLLGAVATGIAAGWYLHDKL